MKVNCSICSKEYEVLPYRLKKKFALCCSRECARKSSGLFYANQRVKATCSVCSKEVMVRSSRIEGLQKKGQNFCCSQICKGVSLSNHFKRPIEFVISERGCFEVTSHRINKTTGYPRATFLGQPRGALHRTIYEECFGFVADDIVIRHTCDNPLCINPEHLITGTRYDNMVDAIERGQFPTGEKRSGAKLTNEGVRAIFQSKEKGIDVAKRYKVTSGVVSNIRNGKTWRGVTMPHEEYIKELRIGKSSEERTEYFTKLLA